MALEVTSERQQQRRGRLSRASGLSTVSPHRKARFPGTCSHDGLSARTSTLGPGSTHQGRSHTDRCMVNSVPQPLRNISLSAGAIFGKFKTEPKSVRGEADCIGCVDRADNLASLEADCPLLPACHLPGGESALAGVGQVNIGEDRDVRPNPSLRDACSLRHVCHGRSRLLGPGGIPTAWRRHDDPIEPPAPSSGHRSA